jgi:hypothetical protein
VAIPGAPVDDTAATHAEFGEHTAPGWHPVITGVATAHVVLQT